MLQLAQRLSDHHLLCIQASGAVVATFELKRGNAVSADAQQLAYYGQAMTQRGAGDSDQLKFTEAVVLLVTVEATRSGELLLPPFVIWTSGVTDVFVCG